MPSGSYRRIVVSVPKVVKNKSACPIHAYYVVKLRVLVMVGGQYLVIEDS